MTHWIDANQFSLGAAATLGTIKFWDVEASASFQGSVVWQIRANAANNTPGTILFSGTAMQVTHTSTGRKVDGVYPEFLNTFAVSSISLPAGSYWLVLHNGPLSNNLGQDIFWESAINASSAESLSDEAPFNGNWETNGPSSQLAFQLIGVPDSLRPRITAISRTNGVPQISFTTVSGQNYRMEYKNNITDASWTTVSGSENVPGTGGVVQKSDPDPTVVTRTRRFYRVMLL